MTATGTSAAPAVGWIGLGDQGLPMARAIAEAGFPLHARARRPVSLTGLNGVPQIRHHDMDLAAASDIAALCVGTDDAAGRSCTSTAAAGWPTPHRPRCR